MSLSSDDEEEYPFPNNIKKSPASPPNNRTRINMPPITQSDFQENFDIRCFISKLTKQIHDHNDVDFNEDGDDDDSTHKHAQSKGKEKDKEFDPSPYMNVFDDALQQLIYLRDQTDVAISRLCVLTSDAEEDHKMSMEKLNVSLSNILHKFRRLDTKVSKVSNTAVRIGHTLETIDNQKKNSVRGADLIKHFLDFNTGDESSISPIFHTRDPVQIHHAAELIQTLHDISTDVRVKDTERAAELIGRVSRSIEDLLLQRFAEATNKKNITQMQLCGRTLLNFRGRQVIVRYVSNVLELLDEAIHQAKQAPLPSHNPGNHTSTVINTNTKKETARSPKQNKKSSLSISKSSKSASESEDENSSSDGDERVIAKVPSDEEEVDDDHSNNGHSSWGEYSLMVTGCGEALSDHVSVFNVSFSRFLSAIVVVLRDAARVTRDVFPTASTTVIKSILDPVFSRIQQFLDHHLNDNSLKRDEHLTILFIAYQQTEQFGVLVGNILRVATGASTVNVTDDDADVDDGTHNKKQNASNNDDNHDARVGLPALSPSSSSASSSPSSSLSSFRLSSWSSSSEFPYNLHDSIQSLYVGYRVSYVDREREYLVEVCDRLIKLTLSRTSAAMLVTTEEKDDFFDFGRKKKAAAIDAKQRFIVQILGGNIINTLLDNYLVDSLKRCDKLSDPQALADNVFTLYSATLSKIMDSLVNPIYTDALSFVPASDPKEEPGSFFLQVVRLINEIAQTMAHFQTIHINGRLASSHLNAAAIGSARARELLVGLENRVLVGLESCLNSSIRWVEKLLSKHKSNDYRPKEETALFDPLPSKACESVCSFVSSQYGSIVSSLEGKNLDKYLTVFGLRLHNTIVNQFHNMQVSNMGAGLIKRDVKEYENCIRQFHISHVNEKFSELHNIVEMFFVPLDSLRMLLSENARLSRLDPNYVHDFLKMRTDYSQNKAKVISILRIDIQ